MWNTELLSQLNPKIIEVVYRDKPFWESNDYVLARGQTGIHTLVWVESGEGSLRLNQQAYELVPGTVFIMIPGQEMVIRTEPTNTLHFISFHYYPAFVTWEGKTPRISERMPDHFQFSPIVQLEVSSRVNRLFREAYETWHEKSLGYEWRAKLLFLRVWNELSKLNSVSAEAYGEDLQQSIEHCMDYMREYYQEKITRGDLAKEAGLSESYLSTVFKKHTGISPVQYLNKLRLDAAKRLLRTTELPIVEVARLSGYADSFYFARMFAREIGMSPSEYRKA
ncbi:AraC family transcriptional regulator [Paenibacillus swuensis]|uniref:AraC family transcriptional regulator n=1 Tax=Paenibacillus swuensis TaxID=1178515 RepID=UPI000838F836|nr:AraC family transcriptional regulator [Paenibacillus swuensis]